MIKTLKGAVTVQSDSPLRTLIDVLPNNPRNQPDRHIPVLINPGNNEADLIFLSEHPVIVAAVDYGIDADVEADEDGAFVDVSDCPSVFTLNLALS